MKFIWLILGVICTLAPLRAQQDSTDQKSQLHAIIKPTDQSILLRWAPSDAGLWLKMRRAKIAVERKSWNLGDFTEDLPLLISDTLQVWDEAAFDAYETDDFVMLSGYCLHAPYESLTADERKKSLIVSQEQELTNRFSSAMYAAERSQDAARAQALFYEDKEVDLSQRSLYYIKMYVDDQIFVARAYYDPKDIYTITPEITHWSEEENAIVLSWDRSTHEPYFSAYHIERSIDGNIYKRLTDLPYIHAFDINLDEKDGDFIYMDSVTNYQPYYYRIIGLDAFGQESTPSPAKRLMGRDKTPPTAATHTSAVMHRDQFMKVHWQTNDPDVAYTKIKKSYSYDGTYATISNHLSPDDTIFFDLAVDYLGSNFYQVCVYDSVNNEACTYPINGNLNDTIPPASPQGITGTIDTNGIVTLSWNWGQEVDLKGYKVFFANRYDGVYSTCTNRYLADTLFRDTISLNTLTEDIFYRVVAADVRDNVSHFSPFIRLSKPDLIPPGPSVFHSYEAKDNRITLHWAPSTTRDVTHQKLYRRSHSAPWSLLDSLPKDLRIYTDRDLLPELRYEYRILAIDDAGLASRSAHDLAVKSPVPQQKGDVIMSATTIDGRPLITISHTGDRGILQKIVIYKNANKAKTTHKVITEDQLPYTFAGDIADYSIRAFYHDGQKTAFITSITD